MISNDGGRKEKVQSSNGRRGAVMHMARGEMEVRSDRGLRKGETGGLSGRTFWLDGEKFTKARGLGVLQEV